MSDISVTGFLYSRFVLFFFFFFNDTATTEIYTLSLHDALPISLILNTFLFGVIILIANILKRAFSSQLADIRDEDRKSGSAGMPRPISYAVFCLKKKKKKHETTFRAHCVQYLRTRSAYFNEA